MSPTQKFPERYIERITELFPDKTEREKFLECATKPLPKTIRINTEKLELKNIDKAWHLKPTSINDSFFIERDDQKTAPLGKTLEHYTGQIYVQSLSSMIPVVVLNPQPGEKILDLCAAPGSKTTYLAQKMGNSGVIIANEPSATRSKKLASNLNRLGVCNTVMIQTDGTILQKFLGQEFDRILLDAPCSSEGFGRRDASFFTKMWSEKKIFEAAKLQKKLILSAYEMLSPGGYMVYSTCTSAPEENEAIVEFLKYKYPASELVDIDMPEIMNIPTSPGLSSFFDQKFSPEVSQKTKRIYPHQESETWSSESFFIAKIHKPHAIKRTPPEKPLIKHLLKVLSKNHMAEISVRFAKNYGLQKSWMKDYINSESKPALIEKDGAFYLTTKEAAQFIHKNLFRRIGLLLVDKDQNISHEFATSLGSLATKNVYNLSDNEKQKWLEGYDIILNEEKLEALSFTQPQIMVKYGETCLGCGKIVDKKIKNKIPRELLH